MLFNFLVSLATLFVHNKEPLVNGPLDIPPTSPLHPKHEFIPYPDGPQTPEEEVQAARALHGHHYGGDMILPDAYNESGAGLRDDRFRWPGSPRNQGGAVIPFVIDDSLASVRHLIVGAMNYYVLTVCVQFKERTHEKDFVKIFKGNGCWSRIGRNGGMQEMSLGDGCYYFGVIVHQLGHAVGLVHEHQRPDRDDWIWVFIDNVMPGKKGNFNKTNINDVVLWTQYDFDSIMHYGQYAFSQFDSLITMLPKKNGPVLLEPFQKKELTKGDIYNIRKLYQC